MHIAMMLLTHITFCKISEFILHRVWLEIKKAFDAALGLFTLRLFWPVFRDAERIMEGGAAILLLLVVASQSNVFAPERK